MKLLSILVCTLFLIACSGGDEPLVQRITKISAFDVGNDGNSFDIRVTFNIESIAEISEFRIMVIPSGLSESFSKKQSLKLSSDSYTTVRSSSDFSYSVRLSILSDGEGNPIENDKEYVIKILMTGNQFNQLSILKSNELTLTGQGIYTGNYLISGCCNHTGTEVFDIPIYLTGISGKYQGENPFFGMVDLTVDEDSITEIRAIPDPQSNNFFTFCPLIPLIGKGIIINDLQFEFEFPDCGGQKKELTMNRNI